MTTKEDFYAKIYEIEKRINEFKNEPAFEIEVAERNNRKINTDISKDIVLERYATIAAFSQAANSRLVRDNLMSTGDFKRIFKDFSVEKVSEMDYEIFMNEVWYKPLTYIGKKNKVRNIIEFAIKLKEDEMLFETLINPPVPKIIESDQQIKEFWRGFYVLQAILKEKEIAILGSMTSLLHYLLDSGYDCIKPDSAVMEVAEKIGIVPKAKGEKNLRIAIDFLMSYAVHRGLRPSIIDLYFLITKPQEGAKHFVHSDFHPYPY